MAKQQTDRGIARPGTVRCAVYTRKSTDEGLDQVFNSLDAQYEACVAYIASQRHEGWTLAKERYDDGGFSGGTMERPGLQRLLADVAAGKVQVIVLYKIDRLTRSLSDFAKIVDVLDGAGASFVSITQSFNTTTSMGRLTLNMLLSFAQFEREVTAERIRDKFAASRAKGMWMGGTVPLGYRVQDRKLVVDDAEAATVRHIFQRYLNLGSGPALLTELREQGIRTKAQTLFDGRIRGNTLFTKGALSYLLNNRVYIGEVVHKGSVYPGEQQPIIDRDLWNAVQTQIAANANAPRSGPRMRSRSLLAGFISDGLGRRMSPSHTVKSGRRYHYYVTHASAIITSDPAWRMAAKDVEQAVITLVRQMFEDRALIETIVAGDTDAHLQAGALELARDTALQLAGTGACRLIVPKLVERVTLLSGEVEITIDPHALYEQLALSVPDDAMPSLIRRATIGRVRIGKQVKLMLGDGQTLRDDSLLALITEAQAAQRLVVDQPDKTIKDIAAATGQCRHRLARLLKLSWLSPLIVQAIIAGKQPAGLTARELLAADLPMDWPSQKSVLGFA